MPTTSILALDTGHPPRRFHLDKRAADIAAEGAGDPDDLLNTAEVAGWLGVSTQFLEIGRTRGYGPKFVKLSPRRVRYRRSSVLEFLNQRTHAATAEYANPLAPRIGRKAGSKVVEGKVVQPEEGGDAA
jgi:predicted DNA-binding transcriptional regulator AlpA